MASRLALRSVRAAAARPMVARSSVLAARSYASQPTPDEKAAEIINKVPSSSLFTKTAGVLGITGLTAAAVSNELYVANEETVLAVGFFIILYAISKSVAAPYSEWANDHINRIRGILNGARDEHTSAVSDRLQGLDAIKEVVPLTEQLYSVAKETNQLEHANFLLQQESEVKHELKSVLDSWVRYEQQAREAEQLALVKTVEANIASELAKPAFKKSLLEEAISEIERIAKKGN